MVVVGLAGLRLNALLDGLGVAEELAYQIFSIGPQFLHRLVHSILIPLRDPTHGGPTRSLVRLEAPVRLGGADRLLARRTEH